MNSFNLPQRSRIVISEWMNTDAIEKLSADHDVQYDPNLVDNPTLLRSSLETAQALIVRNRTQVSASLLDAAKGLRVVGRLGVGLENIDLDACRERGIDVCPAVGANARSVAEYVLCSAMLLLRGIYLRSDEVAQGTWPRQALAGGRESQDKTLGVIGYGSVGRVTADLALAAGFRILYWDPTGPSNRSIDDANASSRLRAAGSIDALLAASDVVSLHVPMTAGTRHLIGRDELARMKQGAVLINTARGGVIDESAVAASLRAGHLGGAAIDVFEDEPLPSGSVWQDCPNLLLTPHVAGLSIESNQRVAHSVADAVMKKLAT